MKLTPKELQILLIFALLFIILFILIPLWIYPTGANESTNYYYRLNNTAKILPHFIDVIKFGY